MQQARASGERTRSSDRREIDPEQIDLRGVTFKPERTVPVHDVPRDQEELDVRQLEATWREVKRVELVRRSHVIGNLDDHPPPRAVADHGVLMGAEPRRNGVVLNVGQPEAFRLDADLSRLMGRVIQNHA
jgi:hypothetical protein